MPQSPGPQPPLNERLADIVLKAVTAGGVTAGGTNAFWELIKQDGSIPKAIASAVIGLGISYGATLLQPLHQGTQRRLEQAGKVLDQRQTSLSPRPADLQTGIYNVRHGTVSPTGLKAWVSSQVFSHPCWKRYLSRWD